VSFDREDLGRDSVYCDRLSLQRCARCQVEVSTSELVQIPGVGQVCEPCDDELNGEAMAKRFPELAKERE
jgi:hypothetical protein